METWKEELLRQKKRLLFLSYLLLIPQLLMFSIFIVMLSRGKGIGSQEYPVIALHTLGILLSELMYLSVIRGGKFERIDCYFLLFVLMNSVYMFSDGLFWIVDGNPDLYLVNVICNLVYGICPIIMVVTFWFLADLMTKRKEPYFRLGTILLLSVASVGILFLVLNLFLGFYYTISPETGVYMRGNVYYLYIVFPSALFLICFLYILINEVDLPEKLALLLYPVLPYANALIRLGRSGPNLITIETFCALTFFYTNLYVHREKDMIEHDRALTESKLRALQMQINPHFFYNTLSSVASLCETSPEDAQEMIYRVSDYLHDSFSDISRLSLIPFSEELTHLEHYISIEAMRFPNIRVLYDIEADSFSVPNMTLQPLVENAIKHGICKRRKSAGTITVMSRETEMFWVIRIIDDGVGMDHPPEEMDEHHIGIRNVRTRLELLCNGKLTILSDPGEGTTCEICLPKTKAKESVFTRKMKKETVN